MHFSAILQNAEPEWMFRLGVSVRKKIAEHVRMWKHIGCIHKKEEGAECKFLFEKILEANEPKTLIRLEKISNYYSDSFLKNGVLAT